MKLPIKDFPSDLVRSYERVGSQVTCNPPPPLAESDIDWLVYVWHGDFEQFTCQLLNDGWKIGGSKPEHWDAATGFNSFTKEIDGVKENVIGTADYNFFCRFNRATILATKFNVLKKADRIELFQAILYGK